MLHPITTRRSSEVDSVVEEVDRRYRSYDWDTLDQAGFNKRGDYCFIYSYPPVRTLDPIHEDALFAHSPYGNLEEVASLYIHIPYCTGICSYCYFAKVVDSPHAVLPRSEYPAALRAELQRLVRRAGVRPKINSIHFGGGTPSLLDPDQLEAIMSAVHEFTDLEKDAEVTLECAPETIDRAPQKLKAFRALGVNRLNLGVESLDDSVLRIMGRRHKSDVTLDALGRMFEAGYDNINVDLIYDLPGQDLGSWIQTLLSVADSEIHSISTYRLRKHPKKGISKLDVQVYPHYAEGLRMQLAHEVIMGRNGFVRSSSHKYARGVAKLQKQVETKRGVEQNQLISLGCGAYGFINGTFYWNTKSLREYAEAIEGGRLPIWIGQQLDREELMRKSMAMGMHTNRGVCISAFERRYGETPHAALGETVERLVDVGILEEADDHVRPTEQGRFFSDEISVAFYSPRVRSKLEPLGMKYGMFFENDKYA